MGKPIVFYKNLYDTYNKLGLPVEGIDRASDFTINNLKGLHPELPFKSHSYRPNYFSLLFVKDANGRYTTDELSFESEPGTIYFTNPGHQKSFEWTRIEEVYLITFTEQFLKENVRQDIFTEFPFLLAETVHPKVLEPASFAEFEQLYLQIYKESGRDSVLKRRVIAGLFLVLLLKIKEYFWLDYNPISEGNRGSQIVRSFKRDLESHFRDLVNGKADKVFRAHDLAALQSLHPSYLNNVIKSKTGKSITTWISEKTISEAKSLLQQSTLSIKEIAYLLGFAESTHFSNYFKKYTDRSPADYRKQGVKV
ncbi:MAG: helix-turn-helix transcriptional regulator [Bacteroidetes bacterium]|nr:helix-turn-helix transcriptional regulator [Bacteroidota bacterium]